MRQPDEFIIGIDTGGTFTDVTVVTRSGEVFIDKAPTTPHDFSQGVMDALQEVARQLDLSESALLSNSAMFKHGTTVATNALITRNGSRVGLITTRGFEDTTFIMRAIGRAAGLSDEDIRHMARTVKPTPIVPRTRVKGVTERIDFRGNAVIPPNMAEAREAIRSLVEDHEVEAIAVNFLWGFVNPTHEKMIRDLVGEMYPERDLFITLSSELVPVIREYARSNTVVINSFLARTVNRYIGTLSGKLKESGYRHPMLIMQANGGIVHEEEMRPIGILHSGPCGGMIASKFMADLLGHQQVITTDMGGTSFDVGIISDGFWGYAREPIVERFHITWPMLDIESIGAGGGTIAWIDDVTGRLMVGPNSAGASPGPVCYDRGGTEPTVTDVDVVLGLINPDYFLGGRMRLNKQKAEQAIKEKIADPLGMSVIDAAAGIYEIINSHMSDLIRKRVIALGRAPEEFSIYSFGGAGPVHAAGYSDELGVDQVYVFPTSPVFSSFGIASADIIHTFTGSYRYKMPVAPEELNRRLMEIEEKLYDVMEREGIPRSQVTFRRTFYMRYRRQLNELAVQVPAMVYSEDVSETAEGIPVPGAVRRYTEQHILEIMQAFEEKYEQVYGEGSAYSEAGIELISFTVDAIGRVDKPRLRRYSSHGTAAGDALKARRPVFFGEWMDTAIYDYGRLRPGNTFRGPAIVETPITTIVVLPHRSGRVDEYLNVILERS